MLTTRQVKRALRALESDAYKAARKKNPALPEIRDRASLENTFKLLPLSMLALRVIKSDPHEGHDHAPGQKHGKRVKGLWTVRIEPQQEAGDDMYYVWMWEGSQVMRKVYAALALAVIFALVCYPLWPVKLRQGGYYLSWGFLCFMGLFFAMAIFRVILFAITYFILPPGFWLFPNLWEDVSVVDSFKPVWAWHEVSCPCFISAAHSLTTASPPATKRRTRRSPRRAPDPPAPAPPFPPPQASQHQPAPLSRAVPPRSQPASNSAATWRREWRSWRTTSEWQRRGVWGGVSGIGAWDMGDVADRTRAACKSSLHCRCFRLAIGVLKGMSGLLRMVSSVTGIVQWCGCCVVLEIVTSSSKRPPATSNTRLTLVAGNTRKF